MRGQGVEGLEVVNVSFLQELLSTIADQGRALLPRSLFGAGAEADVEELARVLLSGRGEASGVALASELLDRYAQLDADDRLTFFRFLATELRSEADRVAAAAQAYLDDPGDVTLARLQKTLDSPRLEFFRRLNLAPGATAQIVALRRDLLAAPLEDDPALAAVDADLRRLLYAWFNRGFLVLRRVDWNTPAAILEKIIRYEAVHEIKSWDDLRRRLDPADRRCFAFFHPSLVDEPLVFVEVALMGDVPEAIGEVLDEPLTDAAPDTPTTAVFYSISNCQDGLRGISFGNFLLKQVVEELAREEPRLKAFVTLSPIPGFAAWTARVADGREADVPEAISELARTILEDASGPAPSEPEEEDDESGRKSGLLALAAYYFLEARRRDGKPVDAVARFHLGNGARLERVNWMADASPKSLAEAFGLMVNYRYDLKEIEKNHEAFANEGTIAASRGVRALLKALAKARAVAPQAAMAPALPPPPPVKTAS
jgi:malonyl-CoA decarboxylase